MSHSQPKRVCPSDPNFEEVVLEWFNAESEGDDDPADSDADAICSEHSSDSEVSSLSSQDEDDQDKTFGDQETAKKEENNKRERSTDEDGDKTPKEVISDNIANTPWKRTKKIERRINKNINTTGKQLDKIELLN
ncbi:hypothetical protein FQA39_LY13145 [Lamprigera yunnana]|nr:hypothetical protein FQA39_LY13145 [Lamprigera yunnana]